MMELNGQITLEQQLSGTINACGERGPAGKDARLTLLWQNEHPDQSFNAETVELSDSLANYSLIIIEAGLVYNGVYYAQGSCILGANFDQINGALASVVRGNKSMQFYTRNGSKVDDTHISFDGCRLNSVTKATGVWATEATNQLALIPIKIYGMK